MRTTIKNSMASPATILYAGMIASLALSIITSIANTHLLGTESFGKFKYAQSFWTLGVTLSTFGVYSTGSYLHLNEKSDFLSKRLGTLSVFSLPLTFFAVISTFSVFLIESNRPLASESLMIAWLSPMLIGAHLQAMQAELFRAGSKPVLLAANTISPQILYLASLPVWRWVKEEQTPLDLSATYLLSILVSSVAILLTQKPVFRNIRQAARELATHHREIGLKVYLSTILTALSSNAIGIMLGATGEFRQLGLFSLAATLSAPLALAPNAFANAKFRNFSTQTSLPLKNLLPTIAFSSVSLVAFGAVLQKVVAIAYPPEFAASILLAIICGIGATIHGIGDIYNRFLLAKGKTSPLLRNSLHLTAVTIFAGLPIAYIYEATGAAIAKAVIDILYLASMIWHYRQSKESLPR